LRLPQPPVQIGVENRRVDLIQAEPTASRLRNLAC